MAQQILASSEESTRRPAGEGQPVNNEGFAHEDQASAEDPAGSFQLRVCQRANGRRPLGPPLPPAPPGRRNPPLPPVPDLGLAAGRAGPPEVPPPAFGRTTCPELPLRRRAPWLGPWLGPRPGPRLPPCGRRELWPCGCPCPRGPPGRCDAPGPTSRRCGSGSNEDGTTSTGTFVAMTRSISRRNSRSSGSQKLIATPLSPARAVRPMRCT